MANSDVLNKIKSMATAASNSEALNKIKSMGASANNSKILNKVKDTFSSKKVALPYGNPLAPAIYKAPSTASKVLSGAKKLSIPGLILSEGFLNTDDSSEIEAGREVPNFDFKNQKLSNTNKKLSDAISKKFAPSKPEIVVPDKSKADTTNQNKKQTSKGTGKGSKKVSVEYGTDLLTPDQVRELQKASGELKVDGLVGPKTRAYAEKNGIPLTQEQFNAQSKASVPVVVPSTEIPYTGKYSNMENAALFNNLPSNVTLQDAKKQVPISVEPGLASSTQFNANDFKRFDDIRALQAEQGMSELEAMARYGQGVRPNASGLADAVTPNKAPVSIPVSNVVNPNQVLSDNLVKATKRQQNGF